MDELSMNPNAQIVSLESELEQRDSQILKLKRELEDTHRYINTLIRARLSADEVKVEADQEDDPDGQSYSPDEKSESADHDAADEQANAVEDAGLPEVICSSDVYACSECGFEVLDGICHSITCGLEHQWPPKVTLDDDYSISIANHSIHPDRSLVPRATTPLRDYDSTCNPIPREYRRSHRNGTDAPKDRKEEYMQLCRRGANRLMCQTFHLEYTYEGGIYAWADPDIFEKFAAPLMQQGDFWKIYLGRRIQLDGDDLDGSTFIDDLLEDVVMFPIHMDSCSKTHERWETKEETPGIWVTRPMAHKDEDQDAKARCESPVSDDEIECCDPSSLGQPQDLDLEQPALAELVIVNEYSDEDDHDGQSPGDIYMSEGDFDDRASHNSSDVDSDSVAYDQEFASGPHQICSSDMTDGSDDGDL